METYPCTYSLCDKIILGEGFRATNHLPVRITLGGSDGVLFLSADSVRRLRDRLTKVLEECDG